MVTLGTYDVTTNVHGLVTLGTYDVTTNVHGLVTLGRDDVTTNVHGLVSLVHIVKVVWPLHSMKCFINYFYISFSMYHFELLSDISMATCAQPTWEIYIYNKYDVV